MANSTAAQIDTRRLMAESSADTPVCVMTFNANDPSGAAGLTADITAISSAGGHPLAVVTGAYVRDTSAILSHVVFNEDAVTEQARMALEDMPVGAIKVGFVGSPENINVVAQIACDYPDVPLVAYMPDLSWWDAAAIDDYLDAFRELILPQAAVLVGNHSSLWRWLLPDWPSARSPSAKDIAKAAAKLGVPYTLVTGVALPDQFIDNVLATPQSILYSEKFERFEAVFSGAGETLSAALAALLANGHELQEATAEALAYLDSSLQAGFHPGMGHVLPDRMFWAQAEDVASLGAGSNLAIKTEITGSNSAASSPPPFFDLPPHGTTKH